MSSNNGGPSPWGSPGGGSGRRRRLAGNGRRRAAAALGWRSGGPGGPFGGRPGGPADGPAARPRPAHRQAAGLHPLAARRRPGRAGAFTGGRGLALIAIGVVALWLASGFYRVQPDEQGVVLRFGAFRPHHAARPELPSALADRAASERPRSPASTASRSATARPAAHSIEPGNQVGRDVLEESLMLTGDENIIDIDFAVFWRINDAGRLPVQHPQPAADRQGGGGERRCAR